ncbi:MAG: radical SAM protein [Candidatus Aminicenantes bacterium]|nr:radical SAM protein [Candidatus Aminicenantes bacterium]
MTKPSVLLLNPPGDKLYIRDYYCSFSSKASYYWPPQDLLALSGILSRDFEVHVLDAIIPKRTPEDVLAAVASLAPAAVVFTTGTATLKSDLALMEKIRAARPEAKITASAGIMKFIGRELLETNPVLDAVLLDFSDSGLPAYLAGTTSPPFTGLLVRTPAGIVEGPLSKAREFAYPVPRHELFDFRKYRLPIARRFPFTVVVTSLGCPYHCGFCTAGAFGYKVRAVDNVLEELKALAGLGVKEILFQDPTFTINTRRVVEICRGILEAGLDLTWSCNADLHALDEDKMAWMKKAGCHTVSVGIESGDDGMLTKYSKMITVEEVRAKVARLNAHKIKVLGYFILGLPGETRASAERTIALARSLKLDIASFAIATPDLGTRLREEAVAKGWIPAGRTDWDSTEFPILETGTLTREEIWDLRRRAVRAFFLRPGYILGKLLGVRSPRDAASLVSNALALLRK